MEQGTGTWNDVDLVTSPSQLQCRGVSRAVPFLILLSLLTFFLGLGRPAITDSDEAYYAEASREIVELADWLTPHFNYKDRWQKPVLYYWLTAATYLFTGPTEWAARLWSALSGLGLVLSTWLAARQMGTSDRGAWIAGAIVATCFGCVAMARSSLPDLPLAFFTTVCIWAALRASVSADPEGSALQERPYAGPDGTGGPKGPAVRDSDATYWVWAGIAGGLGFLMKGPVAVIVPALVLLPIWLREWKTARLSRGGVALAIAVAAIVGLPWYAAMTLEHGTRYLESFFIGDNLERFATDRFNERRPIWFYIPIVLGGLVPWSAYLVAFSAASFAQIIAGRRRLSDDDWRLLLWAVLPLVLFAVSVGQQPRYILPVLPPLAILLARSLDRRIVEGTDERRSLAPALAIATWITAALMALAAVLMLRARPVFIAGLPLVGVIGSIALGAASVALVWIAIKCAWNRLAATMTASAVLLVLTLQFGALAGIRPEPVEEVASLVRAHRTGGEPVGQYRVFVRNLVFYLGFEQTELLDEKQALEFLQSPERVILVVTQDDLLALQAAAGTTWQTLGRFEYLNTANIRVRDVLWPEPADDIDTVVVVANR